MGLRADGGPGWIRGIFDCTLMSRTKRKNVNTAADFRIDSSIRGTDESSWQTILAPAPLWSPGEGPLLIISPHPDNEVLAAGGLIHMWKQAGRRVTILSLTDGEAAYPHWRRLAQVRREELKEALRVLSQRLRWMASWCAAIFGASAVFATCSVGFVLASLTPLNAA